MIWIYKGKEWDTVLYKGLQDKLDDGWSTKKPEAIDQEVELSDLDKIKIIADENGVKYRENSTYKYIEGKLLELGIDL